MRPIAPISPPAAFPADNGITAVHHLLSMLHAAAIIPKRLPQHITDVFDVQY